MLSISAIVFTLCGYLPLRGQNGGAPEAATQGGETGRYFALVIGIDKYSGPIPELHTAVADARAIADILEKQYGFQVTLLTNADATRARILDKLGDFQLHLTPDDNLLIYYAGHGFRIDSADKSFWLPVDATSKLSSNRISSDDLTTDIAILKARHVLVISDSCYSGGLTRGLEDSPAIGPDEAFLRKTLSLRSRNIMASGLDEPVADGGPDGHSVFAWALLQAFSNEPGSLFTASSLFYGGVQRAVAGNSEQIPIYQPVRNSGDIGGDFVFRRITATRPEVQARLSAKSTGFDRGVAYYKSGNFTAAAQVFSESCTQGDIRSCGQRGDMYYEGEGGKQDFAQALALFRKTCDAGNAISCGNLGLMYELGQGVKQDYMQTLELSRKSCDMGEAMGCGQLGSMYEGGLGVKQDYAQALALFGKICDWGDANGCNALGYMYFQGWGVNQNYAQALAFYRKSCDGGEGNACNNLGFMYETGQGVAPDKIQAVEFYRKGCAGGSSKGCTNLKNLQERAHVP